MIFIFLFFLFCTACQVSNIQFVRTCFLCSSSSCDFGLICIAFYSFCMSLKYLYDLLFIMTNVDRYSPVCILAAL